MLKIKNYVKAKSLAEAYELNQKKTACILGGMVWLKMSDKTVSTAIDISGLGLDTITETEEEFVIGAMTSLRDLEMHQGLEQYTKGAVKESLRHIVGVQFRNCATVGGSIFGRFGFSDVLTMFLAMDTYVELYDKGRLPLSEFAQMKKDRDILVNIIVKKTPLSVCYLSQRNTSTDFPVLTCAASLVGEEARTVIGARPARSVVLEDEKGILKNFRYLSKEKKKEAAKEFAEYAAEQCGFCNPGFIMNVFAMLKEIKNPTEEQIKEYLAGNLCRCSGFVSQTRSILKFLKYKKAQEGEV